jgi:hypothetical protein
VFQFDFFLLFQGLICCASDVLEGRGLVQVAITVAELLKFHQPRSPAHIIPWGTLCRWEIELLTTTNYLCVVVKVLVRNLEVLKFNFIKIIVCHIALWGSGMVFLKQACLNLCWCALCKLIEASMYICLGSLTCASTGCSLLFYHPAPM